MESSTPVPTHPVLTHCDPTPLNLGIVAHVDAGKTSLTERLLHDAGVIDALGSVNAGTTVTDSMELERRRGITIRASVTSFDLAGLPVNLLDTPGHPDFIAEVERSLTVLDGAVLVLSAVEGVQPQSVVIWRALQRLGVPALVFVNKVDRAGADVAAVAAQVRRRLSPVAPLLTTVEGAGTAAARVSRIGLADESVVVALAEADDALLERWASGRSISPGRVRRTLRRAIGDGRATAVCCGSAVTGAGMDALRALLRDLVPRPRARPGTACATVFAIDRGEQGRRAWLRIWSGSLAARERVELPGRPSGRITEVAVTTPRGPRHRPARSGDIAAVTGLNARIGDQLGAVPPRPEQRFAPPVLQTLVEPVDPTRRGQLYAALTELAEEDPLIGLHLQEPGGDEPGGHETPGNESGGQAALNLHGEVQREVIAARLADEYGIATRFSRASVRCIERLRGPGTARDLMGEADNPYLAGLGVRLEPRPPGHGVSFDPGIEPGRLPRAFVTTTERAISDTLRQGLSGWEVTDCHVELFDSGYDSVGSAGSDFRGLAPVVTMAALRAAGTVVCEPVERAVIELPHRASGAVMELVGRLGGVVTAVEQQTHDTRLTGELASRRMPELAAALPDLTGGEAVLLRTVDHHAPAREPVPRRRRTGWDPADRQTWFRRHPR